MTRTALFVAAIALSTGLARADDHGRDIDPLFGEWKALFNGKDTSGWQTAKTGQAGGENRWVVEDGALTNAKWGSEGNDICTVEEFGDYELEVEYRIEKNGNSGVYLRGICEIQIFDSAHKKDGELTPADAGSIYGVGYLPLTNVQKKPGEWNKYRVIHVGHHITVWHNGTLIHDNVYQDQKTGGAMDVYPAGPKKGQKLLPENRRGPLMFQGDHTKVWYRNIRIRPLFARDGWKPLWNGEDLSEFNARNDGRAKDGLRWTVDGKVHAFTNTAQGGGGHDIWTNEAFENFAVYYQYKPDTGKLGGYASELHDKSGNAGFYLRDQWEIQIHSPPGGGEIPGKHGDGALYSYKQPDRLSYNGLDRWNHMFVTCIDGKITVWQNGILIHDNVVLPTRTDNHGAKTPPTGTKAPFKLQGDHGKVWFANLRILPLP